jgi:hypothetical protein
MSFRSFLLLKQLFEQVHFSLPHTTPVDGASMPCTSPVPVKYIDMRFEDYGMADKFPPGRPFMAKIPKSDHFIVYMGMFADVMDSQKAEKFQGKVTLIPDDWWKYAEALDEKDNRVKQALKVRGDFEKVDPAVCSS